jgi:N-acyl-D-amino-acid deacylase
VSVAGLASATGTEPLDALIDLALREGLDTRFDIPVANLDAREVGTLLQDRRTLLGLSDAGAHANQQCDASFSTHLLGHWSRDLGTLSLEQAVWRLTGQPAAVYGFTDRGVIRPGAIADLVAFDPDTVAALPLELVHDFPGGSSRLISRSRGVVHTWVAGESIRSDDRATDAMPGAVVRATTATPVDRTTDLTDTGGHR